MRRASKLTTVSTQGVQCRTKWNGLFGICDFGRRAEQFTGMLWFLRFLPCAAQGVHCYYRCFCPIHSSIHPSFIVTINRPYHIRLRWWSVPAAGARLASLQNSSKMAPFLIAQAINPIATTPSQSHSPSPSILHPQSWRRWLIMTANLHSPPARTAPPPPLLSGDEMRSAQCSAMPAACSSSCTVDLGR